MTLNEQSSLFGYSRPGLRGLRERMLESLKGRNEKVEQMVEMWGQEKETWRRQPWEAVCFHDFEQRSTGIHKNWRLLCKLTIFWHHSFSEWTVFITVYWNVLWWFNGLKFETWAIIKYIDGLKNQFKCLTFWIYRKIAWLCCSGVDQTDLM